MRFGRLHLSYTYVYVCVCALFLCCSLPLCCVWFVFLSYVRILSVGSLLWHLEERKHTAEIVRIQKQTIYLSTPKKATINSNLSEGRREQDA